MKLTSIQMPSWWKPWHKFQAINSTAVVLNLISLWLFWDHPATFINWFALGMSVTLFANTAVIWKVINQNRDLVAQNTMIADLLRSEVGKAISSHLENFGLDQPPRPPTQH